MIEFFRDLSDLMAQIADAWAERPGLMVTVFSLCTLTTLIQIAYSTGVWP